MAPLSLKTLVRRMSGHSETPVAIAPPPTSASRRSSERSKRTSRTNLVQTMRGFSSRSGGFEGESAPAELLRGILRGASLSKAELDAKLLEIIIKLDALAPAGRDDTTGWEARIGDMDLREERWEIGKSPQSARPASRNVSFSRRHADSRGVR